MPSDAERCEGAPRTSSNQRINSPSSVPFESHARNRTDALQLSSFPSNNQDRHRASVQGALRDAAKK